MSLEKKVADYWKSYGNSNINHALINFEHIEEDEYFIDEDQEEKILELLEFASENNLKEIDSNLFFSLLNSLPAAYMFYVIHELNNSNSEYVSALISEASKKKDDDRRFFYDRNVLFEKMQILSRVFSSDRVNKMIRALSE
ncbi:type IVB secretion system protein IcmW [Piscirickettsia salmonis]|uniref:type IVB secretion system protein IcmW n=1 Tax=Piscirickettsia salmonis TaxID=1238 RepID=UPI0007C96911|nr:hypothetical protein A0O36_00622 [Piscirickettsiaceae bacterium NZ-RLO1]